MITWNFNNLGFSKENNMPLKYVMGRLNKTYYDPRKYKKSYDIILYRLCQASLIKYEYNWSMGRSWLRSFKWRHFFYLERYYERYIFGFHRRAIWFWKKKWKRNRNILRLYDTVLEWYQGSYYLTRCQIWFQLNYRW